MEKFNGVMRRFGFDPVRVSGLNPVPYGSAKEYLKALEGKYQIDTEKVPEAKVEEEAVEQEEGEEETDGEISK
jgi:hypothetical protein